MNKKTTIEQLVALTLVSMGEFANRCSPIHFKIPVWCSDTLPEKIDNAEEILFFSTDTVKHGDCPPAYVEFDFSGYEIEIKKGEKSDD